MVAPVVDVFVLAPAVLAQREVRHRGVRAVVGQPVDEGVARPALGAVDEGVPVAAGGGVSHFVQAIGADEVVRRHVDGRFVSGIAEQDFEPGVAPEFGGQANGRLRIGQRRGTGDQCVDEPLDRGWIAFGVDLDAAAAVPHPAGEAGFAGEPADERAEPHALHTTADLDALGGPHAGFQAAAESLRTPAAHQMRQAPSSETMQGPTGLRGVQGLP
ncbi:protein of unknown function [Methylococcus capsulatus]|uniref:Uncharacterized protein n=1 Tax=Methylococcus capsulatus TaxID=414 RepID=A0AA35V6L4_METCP|nr:protein of unknown function [Methylococcus capsulatus]